MRVLVTRPAGQADALIAGLRDLGLAVTHLPMLALEPRDPLPAAERQRLLDLERYEHVIFVSANAARFGLELMSDYWPQFPAGQRYWAVGESTARLLEHAGLPVAYPPRDMSTEGLLALPGLSDVENSRVLIVKGEGGRDALRERLVARGAVVETLSCYRRVPPPLDASRCRERLAREPVQLILISSGEGLAHLTRLLRPGENTNLAGITVVVPSARVAEQAAALGWQRVEVAANASDAAMLAAATAWASEARRVNPGEQQH